MPCTPIPHTPYPVAHAHRVTYNVMCIEVLRRKVALEIHQSNYFYRPILWSISMLMQLAKETRQFPVGKQVQWPGVLVFGNSPEGIMISEDARIRILA